MVRMSRSVPHYSHARSIRSQGDLYKYHAIPEPTESCCPDCRVVYRPKYCSQCGAQLRCDSMNGGTKSWARATSQHTVIRVRPDSAPKRLMQSLSRSRRAKHGATNFGTFGKRSVPEVHVQDCATDCEDVEVQRPGNCSLDYNSSPVNMPREFMDIVAARRRRRISVSHLPCTEPRSRKSLGESNVPVDDCRTIQELAERVFKWLEKHPAEEDARLGENGLKLGTVKDFYRVR